MAMAMNLCRLPCLVPSQGRFWTKIQPATRRRAARIVASYAADSADFSSQSIPQSSPKPKRSVAGVDQSNLVDPWLLAEPDSRFAEYFGVQLHYKIARPSSDSETNAEKGNGAIPSKKIGTPAVLLHGFGASLYSWQRVLKPLATILGSSVVAFDRPAFGLTGRPKVSEGYRGPNPFGLEFSARATLQFAEFLHAQKIILIGHSAGSMVALQAYLEAPEKVAAIILIAPAVTAPLEMEKVTKATTSPDLVEEQRADSGKKKVFCVVQSAQDAIWWVLMQVVKVLRVIKAAVQGLVQALLPEKFVVQVKSAVQSARDMLVTAIIRSALAAWVVRNIMDRFGTRGVRMAWYDPTKVDAAVLQGYTKPLQCKDWDKSLLEFVLAMAVGPEATIKASIPITKRLNEVTCPVLIVTGDSDRLVPAWNSKRLASALPNAEVEHIKHCGHLPQEETAEELLKTIERFLARKFSLESSPVPAA